MNNKLNNLIEKYAPELKEQSFEGPFRLPKYLALQTILGDKLVRIGRNTAVHMYYGIHLEKYLTEVDFVIANIVFTLQDNEEVDVFQEYEKRLKQTPGEPEYDYLIEMIEEFLEKNK